MALHLPPQKPSELQVWTAHLELALESRYEIINNAHATPSDILKAVLDSVADARKEMGW